MSEAKKDNEKPPLIKLEFMVFSIRVAQLLVCLKFTDEFGLLNLSLVKVAL